jgi:hypothetical protein
MVGLAVLTPLEVLGTMALPIDPRSSDGTQASSASRPNQPGNFQGTVVFDRLKNWSLVNLV